MSMNDEDLGSSTNAAPGTTLPIQPGKSIPVIATASAGEEPKFFYSQDAADQINSENIIDMLNEMGEGEIIAIRIEGEPMIGDNIIDGDYVLIERQSSYDNNDIVVVSKREEQGSEGSGYATLKHISKAGGIIELQPSNPKSSRREITEQQWEDEGWRVEGKVKAVFRRLRSSSKARRIK